MAAKTLASLWILLVAQSALAQTPSTMGVLSCDINAQISVPAGQVPPLLLEVLRVFEQDPHTLQVRVTQGGAPIMDQPGQAQFFAILRFASLAEFERWYATPVIREALQQLYARSRQYNLSIGLNREQPAPPANPYMPSLPHSQ